MQQYDVIIVGVGFAGAVAARQLADLGDRVLILERRDHIGGNAYDYYDDASILVHRYGPHIFHTSDKEVFKYLSRFTNWREYRHKVIASIHGEEMQVPFNFNVLEKVFGTRVELLRNKLLSTFGDRKKVAIYELLQSADEELQEIGDYVYQNYFHYYSRKQWGEHFDELDPAVFKRVPVLLSYDDHYFQDTWQGLPENGYSMMFQNILDHQGIKLKLCTSSEKIISLSKGSIFFNKKLFQGIVIFTGSIDKLFNYCYGYLPYRTLDFSSETYPVDYYQDFGVVNYTTDKEYTRITEYKHLTGQKVKGCTTIVKEYPHECSREKGGIPYYPIPSQQSRRLYQQYAKLADQYPNLFCLGRLAEYKYYNMDAVVSNALKLSKQIGRIKN